MKNKTDTEETIFGEVEDIEGLEDEEVLPRDDETIAECTLCDLIGSKYPGIEKFRLFLMFCASIRLLGLPTKIGAYLQSICGFAPLAFFILSGILVLSNPEFRKERIVRAIKRTAIVFISLVVFYTAVNLLIYHNMGVDIVKEILPVFKSKRLWFNFAVLNVWPFSVGDAIWYVQSLLYAYIIIYFIEKLKLMNFDWLIFALLMIFTIATGELNGIVDFHPLNYSYLPSNFLNRALPFILLGGLLGRTVSVWTFINPFYYISGVILGSIMVIAEPLALGYFEIDGYYSHLIGMGVVAVSICLLVFQYIIQVNMEETDDSVMFYTPLSRFCTNLIYYLYQPAAFLAGILSLEMGRKFYNNISPFLGLIVFFVLLFISLAIGFIYNFFTDRKIAISYDDGEDEDDDEF